MSDEKTFSNECTEHISLSLDVDLLPDEEAETAENSDKTADDEKDKLTAQNCSEALVNASESEYEVNGEIDSDEEDEVASEINEIALQNNTVESFEFPQNMYVSGENEIVIEEESGETQAIIEDGVGSGEIPVLSESCIVELKKSNVYAGKEVFLSIEEGQVVFYRGAYVTKIPLRGESLLFGRRDVMAGHYPDIDLAMYWKMDRSISRRHLRIYSNIDGSYFVEDICNHNSTFLNSCNRVLNRERVELKPGDRIFISKSIAITFCVI